MGNYVYFVVSYLFLRIGIYVYGFGRMCFQISPVAVNYFFDEKIEWNATVNPHKIKVYFILFVFLTLFAHLSQVDVSDNLLKCNFTKLYPNFIGLLGIISTLFFIENKIKSKTKSYIQNSNTVEQSINVHQELKLILLNSDESQFNKVIDESNANLRSLKNRQIIPFSISDEDIKEKFLKL